ncbi:MAG: hypothetical protein E5X43_17880, partial [Mesorhizobium sp.]
MGSAAPGDLPMSDVDLPNASTPLVARYRSGRLWFTATVLVAVLVATPVLALVWQALRGSSGLWPHLLAYVLPQAFQQTTTLLVGVGVLVTL